MALLFDDALSQYLDRGDAVIGAYPLTIAAFYNHDEATRQTLVSLGRAGADHYFALDVDTNHAPVATAADGGSPADATSTGSGTINTWHHACGVFTNDSNRVAYRDGANANNSTATVAPTSIDRTNVGRRFANGTAAQYWSGLIAEVGIWNVALGVDEIVSLARGASPLLIRPSALVAYWPLLRGSVAISGTSLDRWRDGLHLTENASPTLADHPRVLLAA